MLIEEIFTFVVYKFLQLQSCHFAIRPTSAPSWLFLKVCVDRLLSDYYSPKRIVDFPSTIEDYYSAAAHKEIDLSL
jgi:hypothetical protein